MPRQSFPSPPLTNLPYPLINKKSEQLEKLGLFPGRYTQDLPQHFPGGEVRETRSFLQILALQISSKTLSVTHNLSGAL